MAQKIDSKSLLSSIIEKKGAEEALSKYKVPCLTCPMAQYEMKSLTIGDICKMYGLDCPKIIADLNKL
ncbi:hypothetical protein COT20_01120 [bacterium (Candidatus Gribaldobacteria) CG08_land_8_20_14_0_20_39_15]|uniref:DUF1858 domain-containing protein n=1 Tax=bacterium (Candidatus Gribaldobacteria) CG08_land_8_20_14_0_20_39_15 TaxID=2014273 RepID=A0A2M6XUR8_9BACT|nr:MAG: hypothetical protein COT20_01120 [bacterium (Candidatus Gribaldobacteria) CG08_land_8_20_14_0_20_39_15]